MGRYFSGSAFSAPSLAVRVTNPAGETNVVIQGHAYSLSYLWALLVGHWTTATVAGPGTSF